MDKAKQVQKWVERKFEKIINKDLKTRITDDESSFDTETYVNNLLDKYFSEGDVKNLKEILNSNSNRDILFIESDNSAEEQISTHDSLESVVNECRSFSVEEIIKNLESDSEEIVKKSLIILHVCVEDVITQTCWSKVTGILQNMLNKTRDREILKLVLQIFQKPLRCNRKPQIVCKGFTTIVDVITNQIDLYNLEQENNTSFEEIYDLEERKWLYEKKSVKFTDLKSKKLVNPEVLIKLMWLLTDCQQQIPIKWVRFNETRFREIIFSFFRLLIYNTPEGKKLSGLELVSVLNPTASWCRYWCHTAVGRFLLCSALRKYRNFFIQIIEIILNHIKLKKFSLLQSTIDCNKNKSPPKFVHNVSSASMKSDENSENKNFKENEIFGDTNIRSIPDYADINYTKGLQLSNSKLLCSDWIIKNIPRKIVREAVFFHCTSFVCCLIQFQSGRALFPIQTVTRKRLLSAQELSFSLIEYFENIEYYEGGDLDIGFSSSHKAKVLEMLEILKKVRAQNTSSRMTTDKQQYL